MTSRVSFHKLLIETLRRHLAAVLITILAFFVHVIAFFLNAAFSINLFILVLSIAPFHYFYGEIKGLETDGLQIIHAIKRRGE